MAKKHNPPFGDCSEAEADLREANERVQALEDVLAEKDDALKKALHKIAILEAELVRQHQAFDKLRNSLL